MWLGDKLPERMDEKPSHVATLAALRSVDGIHGQFYCLGAGTIGTKQYFLWYEEEAGGLTPRKLRAGRGTYVYEHADRSNGQVRTFAWHFRRRWWRWVAFESGGKTWEFHIPAGSLKRGYSL